MRTGPWGYPRSEPLRDSREIGLSSSSFNLSSNSCCVKRCCWWVDWLLDSSRERERGRLPGFVVRCWEDMGGLLLVLVLSGKVGERIELRDGEDSA